MVRRDFYEIWLGTLFMVIGLGVLVLVLWMALPVIQSPGSFFQNQLSGVASSGSPAVDAIRPLGIVLLTIGIYLVFALIGGMIMKAGWSVLRPQPELISVRLRPRTVAQALEPELAAATPAPTVPETR